MNIAEAVAGGQRADGGADALPQAHAGGGEMTDAERWRKVAKDLEDGRLMVGLCNTVAPNSSAESALSLFDPQDGRLYWWGCPTPGCGCSGTYDPGARVLAACFLAAMADADGGNHAA